MRKVGRSGDRPTTGDSLRKIDGATRDGATRDGATREACVPTRSMGTRWNEVAASIEANREDGGQGWLVGLLLRLFVVVVRPDLATCG